jgi:glycosyltransferase involved in cell wall biosynthesis
MKSLRNWDYETSRTVHHFIANSENTRQRIKRYYARDAEVIHPPVNTEFFRSNGKAVAEEFYLIVSALVPYKRIDLAIEVFNQLGRPLVIVGEGPCLRSLRRLARSNIKLLGWRNDQNLRDFYARCRALIFPGEEDFGIVPVEAQAAGKPVIAFAKGGVLESVTAETGVFFKEPTVSNLMEAIQRFESLRFDPELIRNHAATFDGKFFKKKAKDYIEGLYVSWCEKGRGA